MKSGLKKIFNSLYILPATAALAFGIFAVSIQHKDQAQEEKSFARQQYSLAADCRAKMDKEQTCSFEERYALDKEKQAREDAKKPADTSFPWVFML